MTMMAPSVPHPVLRALRVAWARCWHHLGPPGVMGVALMLCALTVLASWKEKVAQQALRATSSTASCADCVPAASGIPVPPPLAPALRLPRYNDIPRLMAGIAAVAQAQQLAWPQAEYRLLPLSSDRLGTLEITLALKGSYPQLRGFVNGLLNSEPALAVRDLSLRRNGSDAPEVEARLTLAVFLGDEWPGAQESKTP